MANSVRRSVLEIGALQMLIYRLGFALVLGASFYEAVRTLSSRFEWRLHGLARIPGTVMLARPVPLHLTAVIFYLSLSAFILKLAPLLSIILMTASFITIVTLYLSTDRTGYVVNSETEQLERQIFHHLHLPGLCLLGAFAGECSATILALQRGPVTAFDSADLLVLRIIWACIGAHYFIAAITKLSTQGWGWANRRLFPFYLSLVHSFHLGDTGELRQSRLSTGLLARPYAGVALLWAALVIELSGAFYAFSSMFRPIVGSALIGFHLLSLVILKIDFRENLFILLTFSFNHVQLLNTILPHH